MSIRMSALRPILVLLVLLYAAATSSVSARSDQDTRDRFYGESTIAEMFDNLLQKEFAEYDQPQGSDESSFNSSVAAQQAVLETVAKITREKGKRNETNETK